MKPLTIGREIYFQTSKRQLGKPIVPRNWPQMEEVAHRIASHMDTSFVCVDVYTNGRDTILGELTSHPGGPYFGTNTRFLPEFDLALGQKWQVSRG